MKRNVKCKKYILANGLQMLGFLSMLNNLFRLRFVFSFCTTQKIVSSFLFFFFSFMMKRSKKISGNFILCFVGQASLVLVEKKSFMAEKLKL